MESCIWARLKRHLPVSTDTQIKGVTQRSRVGQGAISHIVTSWATKHIPNQ